MVNLKTLIIEAIVLESRMSDFREKYPNLDRREVDYAIEIDPSGNYKNLDWIGRALTDDPDARVEDLIKYITIFHNKLKSQDIYKLNSFKDLKQTVDTFGGGYKPHATLAYVKRGTFSFVKENMKLRVPIRTLCYSPISGAKTYYDL